MAITSAANFSTNVTLPSGYTNPTLTPIATPADNGSFEVDLATAGIANADPVVGAGALITALESYFDATYAVNTLKLDALATITANLTVQRITRLNDGDDTSIFQTGTEQYRMLVKYEYA